MAGLLSQCLAHDGITQHYASYDWSPLFLYQKAETGKERLRSQADAGEQRRQPASRRNIEQVAHQGSPDAFSGKIRCHEKLVDITRLLQVGEGYGPAIDLDCPRTIGGDPAIPRPPGFDIENTESPGRDLLGRIVTAGQPMDGRLKDGEKSALLSFDVRTDAHAVQWKKRQYAVQPLLSLSTIVIRCRQSCELGRSERPSSVNGGNNPKSEASAGRGYRVRAK